MDMEGHNHKVTNYDMKDLHTTEYRSVKEDVAVKTIISVTLLMF